MTEQQILDYSRASRDIFGRRGRVTLRRRQGELPAVYFRDLIEHPDDKRIFYEQVSEDVSCRISIKQMRREIRHLISLGFLPE